MLRAISLDLWDTLIESEGGPLEPYALLEIDAVLRAISGRREVDISLVEMAYGRLRGYRGYITPDTFAKALGALLGIPPGDPLLNDIVSAYKLAALSYVPKPTRGSAELLRYAKRRGLNVIVITNSHFTSDVVKGFLDNAGLGKYVDLVISSSDYELNKPEPGLFEIALREAGLSPGEVMHIGDSCIRDVVGALLAGIEPVLLARDNGEPALCSNISGLRVIRALEEAIGIIEERAG